MARVAFEVDPVDMARLRAMLKQGSREFSSEMRQASKEIVGPVAEEARFHALASGRPQMQAQARTIVAKSDRLPMVAVANRKIHGRDSIKWFQGANWGAWSSGFRQFPQGEIRPGSSIYPAIYRQEQQILDRYMEAAEDLWFKFYPGIRRP